MLIAITIVTLLLSMLLVTIRAALGSSIFDRILAANAFGTNTVIAIAVIGFAINNESFFDIALVYALINFITTIGLLRYFRIKSFGRNVSQEK